MPSPVPSAQCPRLFIRECYADLARPRRSQAQHGTLDTARHRPDTLHVIADGLSFAFELLPVAGLQRPGYSCLASLHGVKTQVSFA